MKKIFKIFSSVFSLALVGGIIFFLLYQLGYLDFRKFPEPKGAKQVTLNCSYHGKKVSVSEDLYQSIDDFYKNDPKKRKISFSGNYQEFVTDDPKDGIVKKIMTKIKAKGQEMGLNDDQTADLATCLVQGIPYDSEKAKIVLSGSVLQREGREALGRFPYETLYDNKGICTDKSYLEAAFLKELGYGSSLLIFDKEKHMAAGIKTPKGFTSFATDYSYVETTNSGFKVGQLPTIDKTLGGAKNPEIAKASSEVVSSAGLVPEIPSSDFSPPNDIIKISDGKEYKRIVEITQEFKRVKELVSLINQKNVELVALRNSLKPNEKEVETAKVSQEEAENKLAETKAAYQGNPSQENYALYQSAYSQYKQRYDAAKIKIDAYNSKVGNYNARIKELNNLIDEYNSLIKSD